MKRLVKFLFSPRIRVTDLATGKKRTFRTDDNGVIQLPAGKFSMPPCIPSGVKIRGAGSNTPYTTVVAC